MNLSVTVYRSAKVPKVATYNTLGINLTDFFVYLLSFRIYKRALFYRNWVSKYVKLYINKTYLSVLGYSNSYTSVGVRRYMA